MSATPTFEFLEPWMLIPSDKRGDFEAELQKEMRPDHVLAGVACGAVAQRCDCDDVLFTTDSPNGLLAVVHLTWSRKPDQYPQWPHTTFLQSWEDFRDKEMLPEHETWQ